jgi:hypothetical protein
MECDSSKIRVICGLVYDHEVVETINRTIYLQILQNHVAAVIFQQHGAPPHWRREVPYYFNAKYTGCWINREDPILRSLYIPDIILVHFFIYRHDEDNVYKGKVHTTKELQQMTSNTVATIHQYLLQTYIASEGLISSQCTTPHTEPSPCAFIFSVIK